MDLVIDPTLLGQVFVTVLVVMDPLGNVPIFLVLTERLDPAAQRRAAWQATAVAAVLILTFALVGEQILRALGISLPALQVAGGLLLVLVALDLLTAGGDEEPPAEAGAVAMVPLGTPLLAGPGAIAATMVFWQRTSDVGERLAVVIALVAALGVVFAGLWFAPLLRRLLRDNGIRLVSQVLGLLLAAIAVELVASGVAGLVEGGIDTVALAASAG